jgi:hypothetical protein
MKKIILSNSRGLRRSALCILLLGVTALWAMPRTTHAEPILYAVFSGYSIGQYDAKTGAVIQSGFISSSPEAMAFSGDIKNLGHTIFVLQNGTSSNPTVSQYSTTGAVINMNFVTGLYYDFGIAAVGNKLFVSYLIDQENSPPAAVAEFNATTGALINATLIETGGNSTIGAMTTSGDTLFFAYEYYNPNGSPQYGVGAYNAKTGALNSSFITLSSSYIPLALTVSKNHLYVSYSIDQPGYQGTVGEYDATTGAAINATLITGYSYEPSGLAVSGNHLLVAEGAGVIEFNATTGAVINDNFINFGNIGASQLVVRAQ